MPIYDYKCTTCGKEFEIILKMNEEIGRYPGCDNKECDVQRIVSKSSFHLKGSGWYKTDYGDKS